AEQLYPYWRAVVLRQFVGKQCRQPIAAEQPAHRRAGASPGQELIELGLEHRSILHDPVRRLTFGAESASERLAPGPQLDLPAPCAAGLSVHLQVGLGNGVRVEQAVLAKRSGARMALAGDSTVDHDVADMDILRMQLAGEGLGKAAQREFAHGEGC